MPSTVTTRSSPIPRSSSSQAEGQHRDHAIVEQVFADLTCGPLAHLPSGSFPANAAWLTCAAIAHNLMRAAGALASLAYARARGATIRRDLIAVAARTARSGRGHITLRLPRRLAPRTRVDEPVRSRLRPARNRGLTSPDPVIAPQTGLAGHPAPIPSQKFRTSRRTGERQDAHARIHLGKLPGQKSNRKRSTGIGRWIEA